MGSGFSRWWRLLAALWVVALVAAGCGGAEESGEVGEVGDDADVGEPDVGDDDGGEEVAAGEAGGGGVLRMALGQYPPDFDVLQTVTYATQFPAAAAYNLLVRHDPDNYSEVIGDLAESWEWLDDTTVEFALHQGVRFHSGVEFTSADVKYTFERIMDPPEGISSPRRSTLANVASIETPDDYTVVISLERPQPDFLDLVATPFNVIYPEQVARPLDEAGEGMRFTIDGTGPFKLEESVEGEVLVFTRNETYFKEGLPRLDGIEYYPVPPGEQTRAALEAGQVDGTWFIPSPGDTEAIDAVDGLTAEFRPFPIFVNLVVNMDNPSLQDIRVREAMSLAIDRQGFVETVGPLAGAQFPSRGLMPPGSPFELSDEEMASVPGYDTHVGLDGDIQANRERARELLAEAGAEGLNLRMVTRSEVPAFRDSATFIAEQLGQIGLNVEVESLDTGAFTAATNERDFDIYPHSIAMDGAVPDSILGAAYTSAGGRNYGGWEDPDIDAAYLAQSQEPDENRRAELIREFQIAFLNTHYQIQMAFVGYGYALNDDVQGWNAEGQPTLYTNMDFETVHITR
jgi:peptide/nickel transport system substrate-binding protein